MATFATERSTMLEPAFGELPGVLATGVVVIDGREAVRVEFDPEAVSYEQLLDRFWHLDETAPGTRRGGTSTVVVHSSEQEALALGALERRAFLLGRPVTASVIRARR